MMLKKESMYSQSCTPLLLNQQKMTNFQREDTYINARPTPERTHVIVTYNCRALRVRNYGTTVNRKLNMGQLPSTMSVFWSTTNTYWVTIKYRISGKLAWNNWSI